MICQAGFAAGGGRRVRAPDFKEAEALQPRCKACTDIREDTTLPQ
jgi:hypothetical protein